MTRRQKAVREAAGTMIERYGRTAWQQVEQRIRELRENGEHEAVRLWEDIRSEVRRRLDKKGNGKSQ